MKICTICKAEKPFSDFHRQAGRKDGYCSWCKPCKSGRKAAEYLASRDAVLAKAAKYRKENPEKVSAAKARCYQAKTEQYKEKGRQRHKENPARATEGTRNWRLANKERYVAQMRQLYQRNREKRLSDQKIYQQTHREEIREYARAYRKRRAAADEMYVLRCLVRRRIAFALKNQGYKKNATTMNMLGCSWAELKSHIEAGFRPGMSWSNRAEWHIDHIIPLASAKTEAEILKLCHYTNLQPLWAKENMSKGAKILPEYSARAA